MTKEKIGWFLIVGCMVLIILLGWWYLRPQGPRAYVGIRKLDQSGHKDKYVVPSKIAEVDLSKGEVIDTFKLSSNVPIVRDIAVNWEKNHLYVIGDRVVGRGSSKWSTTSGIDIYDLETKELIDRIDFDTDNARISVIRFNPRFDKLFVDNPLPYGDRPSGPKEKITWIMDLKTKKILRTYDVSLGYRNIISPSGDFTYFFTKRIESIEGFQTSKSVYSTVEDTKVEEIVGEKQLIEKGGWQPDPEGKYEAKPFTLDYPQMWGKNPIEFYNRETLELIDTAPLEREGWEVSGGGGGYQETVTKDNKYMVSTVKIRPESSDSAGTPALKVIDLENYQLERTIPIVEPRENLAVGITAVDVEWQ